jgi:polar amino acid transport system substrate-binding protein
MSPVGTFDASVDKAGVKIGTILGAPSDRVLTREIKAAEIVPFL